MSQVNYEKWDHLFIRGEYENRERILAGLTLEEVNTLPSEKLHTIFGELWHITKWQNIVVNNDQKAYEEWISGGSRYPVKNADSFSEWEDLRNEFLTGLKSVMALTGSTEKLAEVVVDGFTVEDNLYSLAVHNAYHLGKIVALRQMIFAWPPPETKEK